MNRLAWHAAFVVVLFAGFSIADLLGEEEAVSLAEFIREDASTWLVLALAIAVASYSALRFGDSVAERNRLSAALVHARGEGDRWRAAARVHSDGLAQAIRSQFHSWQLTASESDIAMLMLKGLSHKEIAILRNSTPATVRQQATAIYLKSGLTSRAGLAAFFLEDLFPSAPSRRPAVNGMALPDRQPIQHMS